MITKFVHYFDLALNLRKQRFLSNFTLSQPAQTFKGLSGPRILFHTSKDEPLL